MTEDLKSKTVSGVIWTSMQKFGSMMLSFVSTIVLARLLTPEDYGYIGMLAIFLAVATTFIDGGFGSALIQKKSPTREDYSTIFYWNLGLSLVLYLLLFFCAPLIASFYKLPLLCKILRIEGVVLIINAVRIVQTNQLRKQLRFKKIATVDLSVAAVSLAVTIYLAWKGFGVWALVVQQLMVSTLTTAIYWLTGHWIPMLNFSKKSIKELFGFGGFILLSNLINTFCDNIQGLLIGRFYSPATLGYYSKAKGTEQLSSSFISSVIDQVCYPVFSEIQSDKNKMVVVIRRFTTSLFFLTTPIMLVLILTAKPVFLMLYSDRWMASVPYFQILCIGGIVSCLININYFAIAAIGKSKTLFNWTLIKRISGLISLLICMYFWGIYGLIIGVVFTLYLMYIINAFLVDKYIGYKLKEQALDLLPNILLSLFSFLIAYFIGRIGDYNIFLNGFVVSLVFFGIYYLGSKILKLKAAEDAKEILYSIVKIKR